MAKSKIAKDKIPEFLKAASADYAVLAPQTRDGVIAFGPVVSPDTVMLDYRNSTISAKELFLPRAEVVYEFDGGSYVDNPMPDDKRVVFAMRPCDCRALALLDMNFDTEQIKDPFYVTRRQNTVVLALGCNHPSQSCFCTATGGDPFGTDGADVLMADLGDSLLAEAVTQKGKDFIDQYGKFFSSGGSDDWDKQAKEAKAKVDSELDLNGMNACLSERFENEVWEAVSRKCLGCGACSYLCPSCYCFDLVDEKAGKGVKKVRTWDCCMFSLFTMHASGHNPRSVNSARMRQKLMHKFSYYPERHGANGCVGCGRCVRSCPVNLDIREVLQNVKAASTAVAGE